MQARLYVHAAHARTAHQWAAQSTPRPRPPSRSSAPTAVSPTHPALVRRARQRHVSTHPAAHQRHGCVAHARRPHMLQSRSPTHAGSPTPRFHASRASAPMCISAHSARAVRFNARASTHPLTFAPAQSAFQRRPRADSIAAPPMLDAHPHDRPASRAIAHPQGPTRASSTPLTHVTHAPVCREPAPVSTPLGPCASAACNVCVRTTFALPSAPRLTC